MITDPNGIIEVTIQEPLYFRDNSTVTALRSVLKSHFFGLI
jgi:hypothetical protein